MVDYEQLPKGYMEKRKKATFVFLGVFYLFCIMALLMKLGIQTEFPIVKSAFYFSIGLNIVTMFYEHNAKITYKNIPIPIYEEIKILTKKQSIICLIPVILVTPFIIKYLITLFCAMAPFYLGVRMMTRPVDDYDRRVSRHYRK